MNMLFLNIRHLAGLHQQKMKFHKNVYFKLKLDK